jgi:predicted PurR-regulated permease PerM
MSDDRTARRFFFILFLIATALLAAVIYPIASALFMAAVFAGVLWPLHARLTKMLRGARSLAAGLLVAAVVLLVFGPLVALSTVAVREATGGLKYVSDTVRSEGVTGLVRKLPPSMQKLATAALARLPSEPGDNIESTVEKQVNVQGGKAAAAVTTLVAATGSLVFQMTMMLIALFFLLVEGGDFVEWLDSVSPLRRGQSRELLNEFKKVSYAVIVSTVITSAVQAVAALIGYLIARVPNPVFFAGVTFFVAFIPAVGAASVCFVAAALLFVTGHSYMALFLAIWGLTVVGLVDNIVKPMLVKAGMEMHGAVVFFALIGGLAAFGTVGLLLGPLVVALFLALLKIYVRDFRPKSAPTHGKRSD